MFRSIRNIEARRNWDVKLRRDVAERVFRIAGPRHPPLKSSAGQRITTGDEPNTCPEVAHGCLT